MKDSHYFLKRYARYNATDPATAAFNDSMLPDRGWYFDMVRMEDHLIKDSTPATPASSLIYALDFQLDRILAEGLGRRFQRHSNMAARVQDWVEANGMELYAPPGYRSKTVTTVVNNRNLDVGALNPYLKRRDMRIANGYGVLKGKTFRIAHMGETSMDDIEVLLAVLDEYLAVGSPVQRGGKAYSHG